MQRTIETPLYKKESVSALIPYVNNSRTHTDEQINKVAASIKEFGFLNPVIVDKDGGILAGHCRIQAAKKLGILEVPVVEASHLSEAQKKAYIIADNRLALDAGWDDDILKVEFDFLKESGFDIELTGFSKDEIDTLTLESPLDDTSLDGTFSIDDETPPTSKYGDIWHLGNHILLCGDSTKSEDVAKIITPESIDAMWTDPPYNVNYEGSDGKKIQNDHMHTDDFKVFLSKAFENAYQVLKPGAPFYIAYSDFEAINFRLAVQEEGFLNKQTLIWIKNHFILGRQDYQWQHEPIMYGWKDGQAHKWYGGFDKATKFDGMADLEHKDKDQLISIIKDLIEGMQSTVIYENKPESNSIHPTMKPINLIKKMLSNSTKVNDVVFDPFGGSGSTLIACESMGRHARLIELDEKYCDAIIERWQELTQQKAYHQNQRTYDEIKHGAQA